MNARLIAIFLVFVFAALLAGVSAGEDSAPNSPAADEASTIDQGSYRASAMTRYQQHMVNTYASEVRRWNHISLYVSAASFILGAILAGYRKFVATVFLCLFGCASLIASTRADDSTAAARYIDHAILEKRWESLRNEWDKLEHQQAALPREQLAANVLTLLSQQASLQSAEPADENPGVYDDAWVEEAQVRKLPVPPKPGIDKQASR